ncbi:MAG: endonuclease/exonuclease/phosphatase family protein [Burkholderiales bacterium]|nr:endonuclease/exonuclease/phosphatase family protein [Burkholderiales bacterium]
MRFRVATLNLEQDHKRWALRRELVIEQLGAVRPDVLALNEVCLPLRTAHWIRDEAKARCGLDYHLVQQTRVNGLSAVEGEALLARFPIVETGNLDYRARDIVALVARLLVGGAPVDLYVTHLIGSVHNDSLRLFQAQQLLAWIDGRDDVAAKIVCGDFNATLDMPSAALMAGRFAPTQTGPTAFTPLAGEDGEVTHPGRSRMDRCIDYIWVSGALAVVESRVCFDRASPADPALWPSDHAGVWADLEVA